MLAIVKQIQQYIRDWLEQLVGMPESMSSVVVAIIGVAVLLLFALAIDRFVRWAIRSMVPWIVRSFGSTKGAQWLEAIQKRLVARRAAHILSVLIVYLRQHPELRDDMTLIVNQLPPGPEGLPIQIVVFCKEQEAAEYERVQADIFDHIIAILPEFGLKTFQGPTSDRYLRD